MLQHYCFVSMHHSGSINSQAYARGDSCAAKHHASTLCTIAKGNGPVLQQLYWPGSSIFGRGRGPIFDVTEDVIAGMLHCGVKHKCVILLQAVRVVHVKHLKHLSNSTW